MRRTILGLASGLGLLLLASTTSHAQALGTSSLGADPFSLYYGWYLPNQAMQSMQPRVEDTLNNVTAMRQYNAYAERAGVFGDSSIGGGEEEDPFGRYGGGRAGRPLNRAEVPGADTRALRGLGPGMYFNRSSSVLQYYPGLAAAHEGRGTNHNVVKLRARRSRGGMGMGGMGMPSMSPGPR
jgi:hypothetical protein